MKVLPDRILELMSHEERKKLGKAGRTMKEITEASAIRLEKELHNQIAGYLRTKDIEFRHERMDKRTTGNRGWPDFTFAVNGRAVALEAKRPGGMPSPEQEQCIARMRLNGWWVYVVTSLSEVVAAVREAEVITGA